MVIQRAEAANMVYIDVFFRKVVPIRIKLNINAALTTDALKPVIKAKHQIKESVTSS